MDLILKTVYFIPVLFTLIEQSRQQTCSKMSFIRPGRINSYQRVTELSDTDDITCVRECLFRRQCDGVNFYRDSTDCILIHGNASIRPRDRSTSHVISYDIPKELAGTCATRPCGEHEICVPTTPVHTCVVWCRTPHFDSDNLFFHLGEDRSFAFYTTRVICRYAYLPSSRTATATCQEDGTWLYSDGWACTGKMHLASVTRKEIRDCSQVKMCHPRYSDGTYWMFAASGQDRVRVRCSNMTSDTPTTETLGDQQMDLEELYCAD